MKNAGVQGALMEESLQNSATNVLSTIVLLFLILFFYRKKNYFGYWRHLLAILHCLAEEMASPRGHFFI